jgi:hypothetical protein
MAKDTSFNRYLNQSKSPHTQINPITGVYDRIAKHRKYMGRVVWDSMRKGTYIRAKHGELPLSKRRVLSQF